VRLSRARSVTIIPLAPASRPGSSNLPEGSSFRAACAEQKGVRSFERTQRAGPALPSYLVLHHAGFALPPSLLPERWALTPPFHPYLRRAPFEDIPKVFLRSITGIRSAGGLILCGTFRDAFARTNSSPGVTRRVALHPESRRLEGFTFTPCDLKATPSRSRSGVRTFLPPSRLRSQASDHPAHPPIPLYRENLRE
jgi:hypothetical protein